MARRVLPPTVEPMTAADVRLRLRYNRTDQDVAITEWIAAARDAVERYVERGLLTQTWELSALPAGSPSASPARAAAAVVSGEATESHRDLFAHNVTTYRTARVPGALAVSFGASTAAVVDLPWAAPLQAVESVTDDAGVLDPTAYAVDASVEPARLYLFDGPTGVAVIRYRVGYGNAPADVPPVLRQTILALVEQYLPLPRRSAAAVRARRDARPGRRLSRPDARMSPPPLAAAAAVPLSPTLNPGALWHVGTVVGRALVDLPNGGQEEQDVEIVVDDPMAIHPLTGRERAESGGILSEATHRIRMHWIAGVKPAQKIVLQDSNEARERTFEIVSVLNVEERALVLDLTVVEKV